MFVLVYRWRVDFCIMMENQEQRGWGEGGLSSDSSLSSLPLHKHVLTFTLTTAIVELTTEWNVAKFL